MEETLKRALTKPSPYSVAAVFAYLLLGPSPAPMNQVPDSSILGATEACASGSCAPRAGWVCSTDRADYFDMCWKEGGSSC